MPAGIPVEPSTLLFDAPDRGFGDLFGEVTPTVPEREPEPDPMPPTQHRVEPSRAAIIDDHLAATVITQVSSQPNEADLTQTRQLRVDDDPSKVVPAARVPFTLVEGPPPNGQNSAGASLHKPVLRRAGSRSDDGGLPDFGQAITSGALQSAGPDTSLSDLAEATGLRRNTGPVETRPAQIQEQESLSDYPVLIDGNKPALWSRLRWPVVVMLLLGMLATAGYFLGFQKLIGGSGSEPRQSANGHSGRNEAPGTAKASTQPETASKPPDTTAKPPEASASGETPASVKAPEHVPAAAVTPAPMPGDVQPTHSLQAASFPNEAGAKEFVEKLIRAGVPSYIVTVDIPRRGKWFRIRVGQFPSAIEATKYAAQARQRAKAAGINLDLIVCSYEKP